MLYRCRIPTRVGHRDRPNPKDVCALELGIGHAEGDMVAWKNMKIP